MKNKLRFHYFSYHLILCSLLLGWMSACEQQTDPISDLPLFELVAAEQSGVTFMNRLRESPSQNILTYEYFYNGAGVAVADFNGDELPDLYFVSNLEANQLYLNEGDFAFTDVSQISRTQGTRGFATGVSIVDINADGLMDIYLCKSGRFTNPDLRKNELFVNQGNNEQGIPVFAEQAQQYGLDIAAYSTQASFFDYDLDGDLDAFLINHGIDTYDTQEVPQRQQEQSPLIGEMLLRNDGQFYTDVTHESGIIRNKLGYGLGIGIGDFNADNFPDVYVSNDYSGKDHLYLNQQDGTFQESIQELTNQISFYAMGNDIGDVNNDGWVDIVNLDMVAADNYGIKTSMSAMNPAQFHALIDQGEHYQYMFNSLLLNSGLPAEQELPYFSNIGQLAGISNTDWSWGPLLFDMDNDGWQDLYITNGIKRNIRNNDATRRVIELQEQLRASRNEQEQMQIMQQMLQQFPAHHKANYFFKNKHNLTFADITSELGLDAIQTASNGAAYADLDLDGDLDLVVNNIDQAASLFRNNASASTGNSSLMISLEGPEKNPFGIGTKVSIQHNGSVQSKELYTSRGYKSSVPPTLHFGWTADASIEKLTVTWPDGAKQELRDIKTGKLRLSHQAASASNSTAPLANSLFQEMILPGLTYRHQENDFDDFERESLLPHKMSNMGPASATGDVNGDGLTDVFLGGARGQAAVVYLQQSDGSFVSSKLRLWENERHFEDVEAVLFDADQDTDLDLIVGGGSNELPLEDDTYLLRFYENDGSGNFQRNINALPEIRVSAGALCVGDFDGDQRADIFVGGRQIPGLYPHAANSYLLQNTSTSSAIRFEDQTSKWGDFLEAYGMVTDATWADINNDQQLDLVIVGEWMAPRLLLNQQTELVDVSAAAQLKPESGWWNSISVADMDGDGDLDLVAGNLGLNYKYKASPEEPFEIHTLDFDENGSQDIVLSYRQEDRNYPLRGRECSSMQMPFIKDKFPTYDAFGKATMNEVYGADKLASSIHYEVHNFAHCYFENQGDASFIAKPLPLPAQFSSINSILLDDFDNDTKLDILCAGNLYGAEVETPRNDASYGHLLKGDGSGQFESVSASESGFRLKGEVRHLLPLPSTNTLPNRILVVKNNNSIQVLQQH